MAKHSKKPRPASKTPKHQHAPTPRKPPPAASHPQPQPPQQQQPTIPFSPTDSILLISEGDFSFAHSLLTHHHCDDVTATAYEGSQSEVQRKYPRAEAHISALLEGGQRVVYGVDATKLRLGGRLLRKKNGWDRIVFNFPHVGGRSRDVNRQVRYNQELLVGFFTSAIPLLNHAGCIVVTLFEGEPYTLWNVRDLARHAGLVLLRSFRFRPEAYPGYRHARTLGVVSGGGGWRGEEREARTFVFGLKGEGGDDGGVGGCVGRRKRKRGESSDNEDDDDDD